MRQMLWSTVTVLVLLAGSCGKNTSRIFDLEDPRDTNNNPGPQPTPTPTPNPTPTPTPTPGPTDICANFYDISDDKNVWIPNFDSRTPVAQFFVTHFDVDDRDWNEGFPGAPKDYLEWYAINFVGKIHLPEDGTYHFWLRSDDGAKFYLNGEKVVWNNGVHQPVTRKGKIEVKAGSYPFNLQYFQGPRRHIALQLWWKTPSGQKEIVPPSAFEGIGCQF